jgi:hypothetical protein
MKTSNEEFNLTLTLEDGEFYLNDLPMAQAVGQQDLDTKLNCAETYRHVPQPIRDSPSPVITFLSAYYAAKEFEEHDTEIDNATEKG